MNSGTFSFHATYKAWKSAANSRMQLSGFAGKFRVNGARWRMPGAVRRDFLDLPGFQIASR